MILREYWQKVSNVVVVIKFVQILWDLDALLIIRILLQVKQFLDFSQTAQSARWSCILSKLKKELLGIFNIWYSILRSVNKQVVELFPTPLNTVLNLIREVSESAHWDWLFGRVLRVAIAQSLVRHNHLRISFGSQSAGFQQGLRIPYAFWINKKTCFNVVDCVDYKVQTFPEFVIENSFSVRRDDSSVRLDI